MSETEPARPAPKPSRVREPNCIHHPPGTPDSLKQPASACRVCQYGPELKQWRDDWAEWLAQNPDSFEAQEVRRGPLIIWPGMAEEPR